MVIILCLKDLCLMISFFQIGDGQSKNIQIMENDAITEKFIYRNKLG